jgi:hypothetical protein
MNKVSACLCIILLAFSAGAGAETVTFTAVESQATAGIASYNADITGGFTLEAISWDGVATLINEFSWGSDLWCGVSGPLGSTTLYLGSGSQFPPGTAFSGLTSDLAGGDPAGVWTFDFYEGWDDGSDGLPDATWDTITFDLSDTYPCAGPDDCASAQLLTESYNQGNTTGCSDTFPSYSLWATPVNGNDHVYALEIPCPGYEISLNCWPSNGQDVVLAISGECADGPVTAVAGADDVGPGSGEYLTYTTTADDPSTMYIYVDSHGEGSAGAYSLSVYLNGTVPNDECWQAIDVTGGGTFSGTTLCARNFVDVAEGCIDYPTSGPEAVYKITVNDGDTVDLTLTPTTAWDPAIYVVSACWDPDNTCRGGADAGLAGEPEFATLTFNCGGVFYIIADSYYESGDLAAGDFDLDVAVTPAEPVDTFDVSMVCDTATLTLPTQTNIRVHVTSTFDSPRQICGDVGVTTCNGTHITSLRAGTLVLSGGETKLFSWGQYIPALPPTCDCTLVFDLDASDCTPCGDAGTDVAGWNETATCGIDTYCP